MPVRHEPTLVSLRDLYAVRGAGAFAPNYLGQVSVRWLLFAPASSRICPVFVRRAGERDNQFPDAVPVGSAWLEQQVAAGKFVQLDWSAEPCGQLPRIAGADDGVSRALDEE